MSGFLYLAIVVGWAVYLVPFALKRYDEAARNRSIDRFSSAMRVLGRRDDQAMPEDADPAMPGTRAPGAPVATTPPAVPNRQPERQAARVAARRRRRVLLTLLSVTAVTAAVAAFALVPWWSVAAPAGLVVVWLMLCRTQVRREADSYWARAAGYEAASDEDLRRSGRLESAPAAADRAEAVGYEHAMVAENAYADLAAPAAARYRTDVADEDEPTVELDYGRLLESSADAGDEHAQWEHAGSGSLWDPVPVTLPTYVHKPRAPRTIRTIDLGDPGVQTSGHTEEYTAARYAEEQEQPADAVSEQADTEAEQSNPPRRAVGE